MKIQEFVASRRQTVQLPGGPEFVIRKIGVVDILAAGGNPDLMTFLFGKPPAERLETITEKLKELDRRNRTDLESYKRFCEAVVLRGVVDPRVTPTGSEDTVAISIFTFEECDLLASAILRFSGFTMEAAKAISPLSRTGDSLPSSMPSPCATGADQASSSGAKDSKPTPSISPVPGQASTASERKPSE